MMAVVGTKDTVKWLAGVAGLAVIYYAAARLGLLFAFASINASSVWPPSGIALAAILLFGFRLWPGIFIGAFAANIAVFIANHVAGSLTTFIVSLAIASGNTLEAVVCALLVRYLIGRPLGLAKPTDIYKFVLTAVLAAALSAGIGAASLRLGQIAPPGIASWTIASIWWVGDTSGIFVVTPLLLAWGRGALPRPSVRSAIVVAASALVTGLILALIFGQHFAADGSNRWLAYLLLPCIGWAAYRYGQRGVTLVVAAVAGTAVWATTRGLGPFACGTLHDSLITLEIFIAICSVVGIVLAADISERIRIQRSSSSGKHAQSLLHWASMFVFLGMTIAAWHFISISTERRAEDRFNFIANDVKQRIDERMNAYEGLLHAGQGLFSASSGVERGEWTQFVEHLRIDRDFPGVLGMGYGKRIGAGEISALVADARADGLKDFHVWPPGEREEYVPVFYTEPLSAKNRRAFGYDMFSERVRHAAMIKARDSGDAAISGKVTLAQEDSNDAPPGFLMYVPVYRNGAAVSTREQRIAALEGYVYCPFRMNDLMTGIIGGSLPEVALRIYDGDNEDDAALMYASEPGSAHGIADYPNAFTLRKSISAVNDEKNWTLRITTLPAFEASIDRDKSHIVLIAGAMISLLFFGVVGNLTATRDTAKTLADEMTAALEDTNRTLHQSEQRFRLLTSRVKDYSILLLDPKGIVLTWNEGAERLTGYSEGEIIGRSFVCFYTDEDIAAGKPEKVLEHARRAGQDESTGWRKRKDGSMFFADTLMTALRDDQQRLIGFAKITRDITQEKRVEQELRSAIEQAESASRAKSEFVANMSHELRTPMNAVLGMTYLLGSSRLSSDQRKYLDMIRASGQSLLDILNDILDFSKIEAGRMELSNAEFRLGDVLDAIATIMSVNAGEKDLELAIGIEAAVPQMLVGDALRLQQIMINLVGNAIKFTESGEVSVLVDIAERTGDVVKLRLRVRDTGIGMSPEQQARLFSPFTQADSSTTRRFGGSGLGLTICRRLCDLMDGGIELSSALGVGSEFCVSIPLRIAGDQEDPKRSRNAMGDLRILVVDDNRTSRDCLQKTAQALGWQADNAACGADAVELVRMAERTGLAFDAVLVDWQMPDMDGIATMQAIRAILPPGSCMPIILMVSAFGRGKLMNLTDAPQADFILIKPVTTCSLFDTLHELLTQGSSGKQMAAADSGKHVMEHHLEGVKILLAEDNTMNQIVAKGMLEQAGASVDIVENGQLAVDLLRAAPERYAIVLMDVQMPVMDGFAATRLIRSALGSTVPVLAMTAGVTESERKQCIAAGMDDFIAKPIDLGQMFATIARFLPVRRISASVIATSASDPRPNRPSEGEHTVLALDQLIEVAVGNAAYRDTILDLLRRIVDRGAAPIDATRRAWREGRTAEAARILHSLRGEVGTLGAERFAQATRDAERAIANNDAQHIESLLDAAERELEVALSATRDWLDRHVDANGEADGEQVS
ncbi:MAG: CHASE domain-containing protein [Burkholderiaceae bacterium]|nr:CHASE domain-containing protein [Burkholderiaceae bacterium]